MYRPLIIVLAVLGILSSHSNGQTTVPGGDISGVWGINGSPYLVEGTLTIPYDSTLSIEPGVIVEFQGYYSIQVQGNLLAIGNESDSILFTVNDTTGFSEPDTSLGAWNGIRFIDTKVDNDSSKIIHCCLQYSKAVGPVWFLNAGGAISILQFGKVLISDCLFQNNLAGSPTDQIPIGGALYLYKSNVTVNNNIFLNNRADLGGAIFMDDSDPVFKGNLIIGNRAVDGAGISMGGTCHPSFTDDIIMQNVAEFRGGGLLLFEPSIATCNNLIFSDNKAIWGGGVGIPGGTLQANDCLFEHNSAETWGGGVAGDFATLNLNQCAFLEDSSAWGSGGLHMDHADAEINNCSFTGNHAVFGGGFHAVFSQVISDSCLFISNQSETGGAIHLENSDCVIDRCRLEKNRATNGFGGAVDYWADTAVFGRSYHLTLSRSMISENSSLFQCGAVRIEQDLTDSSLVELEVDSCQFTMNHADRFGTVRINGPMDDFRISNSIFAGNTSNLNVAGPGFTNQSNGTVSNSVFSCNYALYTDSSKTAHGASLGTEAEVDFINCTFVDTSSTGGFGIGLRRGSKGNILNCILWGIGDIPINIVTAADLGCSVSVNYCDIENGIDSIFISDSLSELRYGEGNISEDPLFADQLHGDLHLTDTSPCIGAGINSLLLDDRTFSAPLNDIEGSERPAPQGSQADMGAYEHLLGFPVSTGPFNSPIQDHGRLMIFPNPFSESTAIAYQLANPCTVVICIYNLFGQKIETLVSGYQLAGEYRIVWNARSHQSGTYFCRITTNMQNACTVKLLLLK